ncbi:hypothetical protein SCUP234_00804 [Seiridium cupressi]
MESHAHDNSPSGHSQHTHHDSPLPTPHRHRKHRRRRSAAHYSTSRSPLRGRPRDSSGSRNGHRSTRSSHTHSSAKSPFHTGLNDILRGLFGHGERGPNAEELTRLADDFGNLIVTELVDRLIVELKDGLLEKPLIECLEDLVTGAVKKTMGSSAKGKGKAGGSESRTDDREDWKKGLLKKAAATLVKRFAQ